MNKEIKEIIELINTKYENYYIEDFLSGEDVKKLVDYITNLQERNDEAIEYIENCEWEDYPIQTTTHHKLREEIIGKVLLNILKGEEQ